MDLVYVYGPPAVGKFTVAARLADLTGYAFFHNHLSIDCALPVFDFGTDAFWRLVHEIRFSTIQAARARTAASFLLTSTLTPKMWPTPSNASRRSRAAVDGCALFSSLAPSRCSPSAFRVTTEPRWESSQTQRSSTMSCSASMCSHQY